MTILDMLDKLEAAVLALQERPASKPRKAKPKSRSKAKPKKKARAAEQLTLPVEASAEQPARVVGKRQALGRSLVQLRKFSSHRPESEASEEPVSS